MSCDFVNLTQLKEVYLSLKLNIATKEDLDTIIKVFDKEKLVLNINCFSNGTAMDYFNDKIYEYCKRNKNELEQTFGIINDSFKNLFDETSKEKYILKTLISNLLEGRTKFQEELYNIIYKYFKENSKLLPPNIYYLLLVSNIKNN